MMSAEKRHNDIYAERFEDIKDRLPGAKLEWLSRLRSEAIDRFLTCGYPTAKVEEWKYTNLSKICDQPFSMACPSINGIVISDIEALFLDPAPCHRMVFVNGFFRQDLSDIGVLPEGLRLTTTEEILSERPELVEEYWSHPWADYEDRLSGVQDPKPFSMVALNTALSPGGPVLYLDRNVEPDSSIHLIHVVVPEAGGTMSQPRTLVVAGEGSRVTVMESYVGGGSEPHLVNALTQVCVLRDARVCHYRHQQEGENGLHIGTNHVRLSTDSIYSGCVFSSGEGVSRNESRVWLEGEHGECTLDGVYLGRNQQRIDNWTRVDHVAPHGQTQEVYKGVMDDAAQGAFQGKIRIWPDAVASRARQLNKNLLLSTSAGVSSKPELEILNDDVRCAHGSTIGDLDEDALFYLRSRGIDDSTARRLMIEAFVGEVIDRFADVPIRNHLRRSFSQWLAKAS